MAAVKDRVPGSMALLRQVPRFFEARALAGGKRDNRW